MKRIVQPELLDTLPPSDPRAIRSRRDLRRINSWMGNHSIMARALENNLNGRAPGQIVELGAGDGNFILRVAREILPFLPDADVVLVDLQKNVSTETLGAFAELGWRAEAVVADAFDWLSAPQPAGVIVANLFLHHFETARLVELLQIISARANLFIAIEPRRAHLPLFFSRLIWLIGCNSVTRHDAGISVRAGFSCGELSALWPDREHCRLTECRTGLFSHLFIAQRNK